MNFSLREFSGIAPRYPLEFALLSIGQGCEPACQHTIQLHVANTLEKGHIRFVFSATPFDSKPGSWFIPLGQSRPWPEQPSPVTRIIPNFPTRPRAAVPACPHIRVSDLVLVASSFLRGGGTLLGKGKDLGRVSPRFGGGGCNGATLIDLLGHHKK